MRIRLRLILNLRRLNLINELLERLPPVNVDSSSSDKSVRKLSASKNKAEPTGYESGIKLLAIAKTLLLINSFGVEQLQIKLTNFPYINLNFAEP